MRVFLDGAAFESVEQVKQIALVSEDGPHSIL